VSTNTSATGGFLIPVDLNGALSDQQLEDLLQAWIVGLTQLSPDLVRPAWQPDPPPIPDFTCPCWAAFSILRTISDWDPVVQHFYGAGWPNGDTVFRNQEIEMVITFYGREAGDFALALRMGAGIRQNSEFLDPVKLISIDDQITVSETIKGRWQRRVDVGVHLRRPVQFTYAVLDVGGVYGTIYSDATPIDWEVTPDSLIHRKGDC
jgi:hypothetical protein